MVHNAYAMSQCSIKMISLLHLHVDHQSTNMIPLFMRILHVKIVPLAVVHTKNAALFGTLAHQMLFQGK